MIRNSQSAGSGDRKQSLSIVVACRNESKHIRTFVQSLLTQDLDGFAWEVIIADGASEDDTRRVLLEAKKKNPELPLRVIDNPERIVSTGLNAAIRASRGEIILRMDAHTEYASDYVKRCVEALETVDADNVGGPARTKADGLLPRAIEAAYHSPFSTGGARFHDDNYTGYVDTVTYGCWRKNTLIELGLFDEKLVRNQDDELNLRLTRRGGKIWQSSEIVSWYRPRTSLSTLFRQYFQYGFWKVAVIRKHKIPGSWRHLVPGLFVGASVILLFIVLLGAIIASHLLLNIGILALTLLLGAYFLACVLASFITASRAGWDLLIWLPVTFAVFHISYGLGFLAGSVYWTFTRPGSSELGTIFAGVTR